MIDRDQFLQAINSTGWNVTQAAAQLGMNVSTFAYHLRRLGIHRPMRHTPPVECHPPVAMLIHRLGEIRARGQLIVRTYLPGPARTAMLRQLEVQYVELRAAIRGLLGTSEGGAGISGPGPRGTLRPAWDLAETFHW
jgi:hypothetical protein